MVVFRAHFDGNVFVPDEPVDVPKDAPLRLAVVEGEEGTRPLRALLDIAQEYSTDETWPADGAAEHDHYLYGLSKNNP